MNCEEIEDKLFELKNDLVRAIEWGVNTNPSHYQFKRDWESLGAKAEQIGKEIKELAATYQPPKYEE